MSTLYEIIELANGEIALKRADEDGEPLLTIRFSSESESYLEDAKIDIAKAMIEAGLDAVGAVNFIAEEDDTAEQPVTLH